MNVRTAARPLGALVLSGALLVVAAPSAFAAGSWSAPSDGSTATSGGLTFTASVAACPQLNTSCPTTTMTVTGPSGFSASKSQASSRNGAVSFSIGVPAGSPNGAYTGKLNDSSATRTASLNVAPSTPSGFSAQGSGARDVSFTWAKGSESDLAGYALYDDAGTAIDASIPLSACSGSTCSYGLYYPSDNPGTHGYQLAAKSNGATCSACLESGRSTSSATLTTPPPSPPSPTPSPTASPTADPSTGGTAPGGSTGSSPSTTGGSASPSTPASPGGSTGSSNPGGGGTGGTTGAPASSTSGGTAGGATPAPASTSTAKAGIPSLAEPIVRERTTFALRFNSFGPNTGIPKLPPLPSLTLPAGGEGPLPVGTFQPVLPYSPQTTTTKVSDGTLARPVAAVRDVLDSERLAKSLAGGLLLLLVGAHLRRFLSAHVED